MEDFGGVEELSHGQTLFTRESGGPASSLAKGKRQEGGINEGENPKN